MSTDTTSYLLIENQPALDTFRKENRKIDWMCFDTEFVGEKRFVTRICLIQVTTGHGNYLIDPFTIDDLEPFLELIRDPSIVKVTHAGDNDYRLLYRQFDMVPANIFDTQIAAGLAGYKYPVSFRNLVRGELGRNLKKGYTVADWETRPFKKKQLKYALNDVLPLYDLWRSLNAKLEKAGRLEWAREEFKQLEEGEFYERDPDKEAMNSRLIRSLRKREQLFLIRLYNWRRRTARQKNHSVEMVLPKKMIAQIVRTIQSGKDALHNNRRIPSRVVKKYGETFMQLYEGEATLEEKRLLKRIAREDHNDDPKSDALLEMLYLAVKYKCLEEDISTNLVLPRSFLKKLKSNAGLDETLFDGWRSEFLGENFIHWLEQYDQMRLTVETEEIILKLNKEGEE
jgi:ribonuclease D